MKAGLDMYYVSTFPNQNKVELHSRFQDSREGPIVKTWHVAPNNYEIIRGYAKDICDIMNAVGLTLDEKKQISGRLENNMTRYLEEKKEKK